MTGVQTCALPIWIYVNPTKQVIIVKTSADPDFMEKGYELKHVAFFRAVAEAAAR